VASTRLARGIAWAVVGLAIASWVEVGAGEPAWQVEAGAGGCELRVAGTGAACPCAEWPARLSLLLGRPLSLNRATAADLLELPGVGPVLAGAIERERREHGPFGRVEDLVRVQGVGAGRLAQLQPWLTTVEPPCVGEGELRAARPDPGIGAGAADADGAAGLDAAEPAAGF
jgi:competence ComEA-like helix-hairpin-helix protein